MRFEEKQKLNFWWLYILIGIETIITLTLVTYSEAGFTLNGLESIFYMPIWLPVFLFGLVYLINRSTFHFSIDENGVEYRYWPFVRRKFISWEVVDAAYLRKYDALGEYGGWGLRYKLWFKLKDRAYIFNDRTIGLQFELPDNRKLLFSTSKKEELESFLSNLKQKYELKAIDLDVRER